MALLQLCTAAAVLSLFLAAGFCGSCGIGHWQCDDGQCIPRRWRCDGTGDCLDGSDEMDCSCPQEDFECTDASMCVTKDAVCDGRPQCTDGSDELYCNQSSGCLPGDWACRNRICIPQALHCNGEDDCGDGSDEEGCGPCGEQNVRCPNGTCLALKERCDGVAQCSDGSDEPVTCGKTCALKNGGCSHSCTDQLWGALCSCPSGMKLSSNGAKCVDINECAQPFGPCMHTCINKKGSFQCRCNPGFKLQDNVCQAQGNATKLLTTKKGLIGLVSVKAKTFETLFAVDRDPVAMAFDLAHNVFYWADGNGNIYMAEDQKSTVLYSGHGGIRSLVFEWLHGQLYWANSKLKGIYTGAPDGSAYSKVTSKDTDPTDLVLLPMKSSMFWINRGSNDEMTIEKAGMDGSMRTTLVIVTAQSPRSLTLDVAAQRLYWISDFKMSIETVKVDGTGRYTFREFFKGRRAQNLAVFNGWFYWADEKRLWQAPQNQPDQKSFVLKAALPILTAYHEQQQPQAPCPCRKAHCQLCLPSLGMPSGFMCSCPKDQLPDAEGSCQSFKLAYASSTNIYTLEYTAEGPVKSLLFSASEEVEAFDVDWKRGWVVWTNLTGQLKVGLLEEGHSEYIPTPKPACAISVDQKTGNVYWVSCDALSIGATHIVLPDHGVSKLLHQATGEIMDLFVDWQRGQLYWLEDGQIISMKLSLVGGNAKSIYSFEEKSVSQIVLDRKANSFLWSSENELQVLSLLKKRAYSAGTEWTIPNRIVAAYEPYMVTMINDAITPWRRQDGMRLQSVALGSGVVGVIVALRELKQDDAPSHSHGPCRSPSVLCKGTSVCISQTQLCDGKKNCPDGSDEASCGGVCPKQGDFQCKDKTECIGSYLVCDGYLDCIDGSDEVGCPTVSASTSTAATLRCRFGSKLCADGSECVLLSHVCDGEVDCKDGSDEEGCERQCKAHQFHCAHGRMCIDKKLVCDGTPQCQDRSDEMGCFTISEGCSHHCDDRSRCIPESFLCDGEKDCADGTDEAGCPSAYIASSGKPSTESSCNAPSLTCEGTSLCINQSQLCDGKFDCPDGFDELFCLHSCSHPGQFLCKNKRKCIEEALMCDGRSDCPDGSDELSCPPCPLHCDDWTVCLTSQQFCDDRMDCRDGADERNCNINQPKPVGSSTLKCSPGFKPCKDGSECILYSHVCDGEKDCLDGSDESDCESKCNKDQFRCAHGSMCIDKKLVCDGTAQCQDRSDEMSCVTRSEHCHHHCDNNTRCIPESFLCDGDQDCTDGSDEADCTSLTTSVVPSYKPRAKPSCESPSIMCDGTSVCVSQSQLCDGKFDCPDGFDELFCLQSCSHPGQFLCKNKRKCIEEALVCDGRSDCPDGSDEVSCPACPLHCDDWTVCLSSQQFCDDRIDCRDGADERNCDNGSKAPAGTSTLVCPLGFKPCLDGSECILHSHVCDGEKDCRDGSDEENCDRRCSKGHFQCANGKLCVDRRQVCDGTAHCPDHSDEVDCCSLQCDKTRCIPDKFLCDGERDCLDGADEADCSRHNGSVESVKPSSKDVSTLLSAYQSPACKSPSVLCEGTLLCISQSQLCDGKPDCPDGSDENSCIDPCTNIGNFRCKDSGRCVERYLVCNGRSDCVDGSDEVGCPTVAAPLRCRSGLRLCADGSECVLLSHVCDGERDCKDGSDEDECHLQCYPGNFRCKESGRCIEGYLVCNGRSDCVDGSDEVGCPTVAAETADRAPLRCRLGSRLCADGSDCVLLSHVCDGERDCKDRSDEDGCDLQCSSGQFQCVQGKKCIDKKQVCDGTPQCQDSSDESGCWKPTRICALRCDQNSRCIPEVFICNGRKDCWDGSDESDCGNSAAYLHCKSPSVPCLGSTQCISQLQLCDGRKDCADGSDERPCITKCPYDGDYLCKDRRKCVDVKQVCDGRFHCTDGSDEVGCPTVAAETTTPAAPLKCRLGLKACKDGSQCILYSHVCDGEVDCKDGSDEEGCDVTCRTGQFQCAHGKKCIDAKLVCDGKPQCQDRSDELGCFTRTKSCSHHCDNRTRCIPETFLCDGETDCADGSDEADCGYPTQVSSCASPSVLCRGGKLCISSSQVCDGKRDCADGFDEELCLKRCPKRGQFLCKDRRKCIEKNQVCDGRSHCTDGSDEVGCPTVSAPTSTAAPLRCRFGSKLCADGSECVLLSHVCDGEVDCKDGSDEEGCERQCKAHQFHCAHGRMCIDKKLVCDGTPQCQDRSDEMGCFTISEGCSHHCDDRSRCIPESFLCDGEKDCADGTDEAGCPPDTKGPSYKPSTEVNCKYPSVKCEGTSLCISQSQLCDGKMDCPDESDERFCMQACSDPDQFLCKNKRRCIEKMFVCDGHADCTDGSDELQCPPCPRRCDDRSMCLTDQQFCDGKMDCRDGSDERNCGIAAGASTLKCRVGFKACLDGSECILYSHVCDGEKDCKDGSDEKDCEQQCKKGRFQCAHGRMCIDMKQVCDGTPQCQDRSDEMNCYERSEDCHHYCDNRTRCLPKTFICDGERDCFDGTDEVGCAPEQCSTGNFQCASGQCVSTKLRCDGHADCKDHSDEKSCRRPPHCSLGERCPRSHECLMKEWRCDGHKDCTDGSDEKNCKTHSLQCGEFQWSCASKAQCIPTSWRCDGTKDCKDQSDEAGCAKVECPSHLFQCRSEGCVNPRLVCNGISDCVDGSDEGLGCLSSNCSRPRMQRCEHYCASTPQGAKCVCRAGFRLQADGVSCVDVDECMEIQPSVCSHKCHNTHGSYACQCSPGFLLEPDGSTCKSPEEPHLLAAVQNELLFKDLRSGNLQLLLPPGQIPVFTLDYDLMEQKLFWVSLEEKTIKYAVHGDKGNIKALIKGVKSDSIAVDWIGRNLYWVDGAAKQILAVRLGNSVVKPRNYMVILDEDLEQPRSLVLLPQKGMMLWSEIGSESRIERAGMDGSQRKLVLNRNLRWPVSLAVDMVTDRIYWTDEKLQCIGSATLDGEDARFLQLTETSAPFSVAVFNDMVYWSDTQRRAIYGAHKTTGKNRTVILKRPGQPFGLKVVHPLMQPKISNPCQALKCSHMCLLTSGSQAVCRCPGGLLLAEDRITCSSPGESASDSAFLLLLSPSVLTQIFTKNLHAKVELNQWPEHQAMALPGISEATGLDLVLGDRVLYLADAKQASVAQLRMDDSGITRRGSPLQLSGDTVTALAVDWITHNLYWSSLKKPQLSVSSPGWKYTAVVIKDKLQDTTSITLHPPTGRLCFTAVELGVTESLPMVSCAFMNGENRMVLWKKAQMPMSLTFSTQGSRLYWADIAAEVIASVDIDGSNYREYKTGPPLIVSFAPSDNILFWVTLYNGTNTVWYSDGVQPKQMWFEVQTNIVALKAYSANSQKGSNLCAENNGGCSQLCLAKPGGRTCRCTQGYLVVSKTQCVPTLECPAGSKACKNGYECLSITKFCDHISDCPDGSDEEDCVYLNGNQDFKHRPPPPPPPSSSGSLSVAGPQDDAFLRALGGQSCDAELCNGRGQCVIQKGAQSCKCVQGYSGTFCEVGGSSSASVVLSVLFILGIVIMAAVFLKMRREKALRGRSIDKETLMKDIEDHEEPEEQESHPQNFVNKLYDPDKEEEATESVN